MFDGSFKFFAAIMLIFYSHLKCAYQIPSILNYSISPVPYCDRLQQLEKLVKHAENKLDMVRRGGGQYNKETDRQRELHTRNYNMLNKMKNGLETLRELFS